MKQAQAMSRASHPHPQQLEALLAEAIASIRYGAVEVTIHDGRIVQIERREKLRPAEPPAASREDKAR